MNALSHPAAKVERPVAFTEADLNDICDAANKAIIDGNGFRARSIRRRAGCWRISGAACC